jgi:histidinol dehydrogenase
MLGIPAIIAGCEEVVLCSPPNREGNVHPAILFAADLIGVRKIFKVGGIQAIAAMSLGTQTIPQVYKIAGPGNQYVTFAKEYAMGLGIAIDLPAGPSELLVLVNKAANLEFVAADLLSQAEHGEDSQVIAVVENEAYCDALKKEILNQLVALPRREIATVALEKSMIIVLADPQDRINFINAYAPEHLIITGEAAEDLLPEIKNAGSIFLGDYSPESAGDYASGTNHTLPTNGAARTYSGVNLTTFLKKITVQKLSKKGLMNIGPSIEIMAEAEELFAHKNAVSLRLKTLRR